MRTFTLSVLPDRLAIAQLPRDAKIPTWLPTSGFVSITRTADELSIVCEEAAVPGDVRHEAGWRLLKLHGPFNFDETGVLAAILSPLADAGVGIFVLSTYNTDYILIKVENLKAAVDVLRAAGHTVITGTG